MATEAQAVGVRELRGKLSDYLRRVGAGESFDVVSRGNKIAELRAPRDAHPDWPSADPNSPNFRKPGALAGRGFWIADDFDDPLPEIAAMEDPSIFPPEA